MHDKLDPRAVLNHTGLVGAILMTSIEEKMLEMRGQLDASNVALEGLAILARECRNAQRAYVGAIAEGFQGDEVLQERRKRERVLDEAVAMILKHRSTAASDRAEGGTSPPEPPIGG